MQIVVKKWGNSLGVIIPKIMANDLKIKDGTPVEIEERKGSIIISPKKYLLTEMLANINDKNLHEESDFGEVEGREEW